MHSAGEQRRDVHPRSLAVPLRLPAFNLISRSVTVETGGGLPHRRIGSQDRWPAVTSRAGSDRPVRYLLEDSLGDYVAMMFMPGFSTILEDKKRLRAVNLAVRGRRGERYGQDGTQRET